MQTFAPVASNLYRDNFAYIDPARCRKNLLESLQVYQIISGKLILSSSRRKGSVGGYLNHPANDMWRNSIDEFSGYILANWRYLLGNNLLKKILKFLKT